ncbi:MAG TPA: sigma-54-dependent Fis family transcriptional regulator [Ignavibacteriales bacterium]|nr:sigma-54-dependent Fis family transcriptional regulator [Ignavibacteriales bacterium]
MRFSKVLIIDDEPELRNLIRRLLELDGYNVVTAGNKKETLELLKNNEINIVVSDVRLPDGNGLDLIPVLKKHSPSTEIIILTAYGNIEDGVKAIKAGAFDYIVKGDEDNKLLLVIKNAHEKIRMLNRIDHLEKNVQSKYSFDSITGISPNLIEVISVAKKVANSTSPILLTGETGTGKEVFAQSIHFESNRKDEPFVAINCSGFAKDLLESEMFGYKAGAFTGAVKNKKGLFEEADRGTLFLDEIGDLDILLQAKLLRVLETNTFIKQGDTKETSVDVRIIAATNKDVKHLIEVEKFRSDLFFRISVIQIDLPPLRKRIEDIKILTDTFIKIFCDKLKKNIPNIDGSFYERISKYNFPGNTRELKNVIERIILLNDKQIITERDLPKEFFASLDQNNIDSEKNLQEVEKKHVLAVLKSTDYNKAETAKILGIGLTTLYRKLNEYGLSGE